MEEEKQRWIHSSFYSSAGQKALSWTSVSTPYLFSPCLFTLSSSPFRNLFPVAFMPWQETAIQSLKTRGEEWCEVTCACAGMCLRITLCLCKREHETKREREQTKPWYQAWRSKSVKWEMPWWRTYMSACPCRVCMWGLIMHVFLLHHQNILHLLLRMYTLACVSVCALVTTTVQSEVIEWESYDKNRKSREK